MSYLQGWIELGSLQSTYFLLDSCEDCILFCASKMWSGIAWDGIMGLKRTTGEQSAHRTARKHHTARRHLVSCVPASSVMFHTFTALHLHLPITTEGCYDPDIWCLCYEYFKDKQLYLSILLSEIQRAAFRLGKLSRTLIKKGGGNLPPCFISLLSDAHTVA